MTAQNGDVESNEAAPQVQTGRMARLRAHLSGEISTRRADWPLIACSLVSGLLDSIAFSAWGCFASMQTGNTIFVGLAVSNQPDRIAPYTWAKCLTAIACFILGAFFFSRLQRYIGAFRRDSLALSFLIQSSLLIIAASLVQAGIVSAESEPLDWLQLFPLGLVSFQAAGQIVTARLLAFNEIPTVVITSLFCDLMSDAQLFTAAKNDKRNRRLSAALALFLGAIIGGWMLKRVGMASAIWLGASVKIVACLGWTLWKGKD